MDKRSLFPKCTYAMKLRKDQTVICDRLPASYVAKRLQLTRYMYNANYVNNGEFIIYVNAVRYMDYFIGEAVYNDIHIHPSHYQLIACVCLWIAEKYHDDDAGCVQNVIEIWRKCGIEFSKHDVLETEIVVLQAFDWDLQIPTICHFIDKIGSGLKHIIRDAVENLQLQIVYLPSEIAMACREIAVKIQPFSEVAERILKNDRKPSLNSKTMPKPVRKPLKLKPGHRKTCTVG